MEQFLRVGCIAGVHGIHGEVRVFPTTDDLERFSYLEEVWLEAAPSSAKPGNKNNSRTLLHVEGVKYLKGMALLKFKEYNDRTEAEKLKGCELYVDREHAVELAEDEFFYCDIMGAKAIADTGEEIGTVTDILETGANDCFVVKTKTGKEVLFPNIRECVLEVNIEEQFIKIHIMKGLMD